MLKNNHKRIQEAFFKDWFNNGRFRNRTFLGVKILKNPCDLMINQELIFELRPDNIIETGFGFGGSSVFYATIMEKLGAHGKVFSVDINTYTYEEIQKIEFFEKRIAVVLGCTSLDPQFTQRLWELEIEKKNNLIFLDSCHVGEYVLAELYFYAEFIQVGGYIVVEDTCLMDRVIDKYPEKMRGPGWAVREFLKNRDDFEQDLSRDPHKFSSNPDGFLRKIK